jgi:hypothetical protein
MNINTTKINLPVFIVLCIAFLAIFFPGSYSVDSWNYAYQFLNHDYSDWHSPVLTIVWEALYKITGQYYSIYILQMILFWVFAWMLAEKVAGSLTGFIATIAMSILVIWLPQYVMKDTHNAITWGIASLLTIIAANEQRYRHPVYQVTVLILLFYGYCVRINAIVALLPLLYVVVSLYWLKGKPKIWVLTSAVVLMVLFALGNNFITYRLLNARHTYPQYKLMMMDLAGITLKTGKNYFPSCVTNYSGFNLDSVKANYTPATIDNLYWPSTGIAPIPNSPDSTLTACVKAQWQKAVTEQKGTYIANRMEGYLYYLRLNHRYEKKDYWNAIVWTDPSGPFKDNRRPSSVAGAFTMGSFSNTFFFDPWFWLLLNIAGFIYYLLAYRRSGWSVHMVLLMVQLSGVLYTLSQFPVFQHDRDFRYNYWNVIVFIIGFVYFVGHPRIRHPKN